MALSDIGHAVSIATVQATLTLRLTDRAAFRSAIANYLKNKYPALTLATVAAELSAGRVVVVIDQTSGWVGIGRGLPDALAAIKVKTG